MIRKVLLVIVIAVTLNVSAQVTNEGTPASWDMVEQKTNLKAIWKGKLN